MDVGTIAEGSSPVALGSTAAARIRAASAAALPNEACGLLFGDARAILEASVARNVAADPKRRFEIDPAHLFEAHRRARAGPLALIGCWHSHPDGEAVPSAVDREGVADPGWLWLVAAGGAIRGWRPSPTGFAPVALVEQAS
jgi:proteasome lid subunit RPN8/RPN11